MFSLGIGLVMFGSGGIGFIIAKKYQFSFKENKEIKTTKSFPKVVTVAQEDITEEDQLSVKQHFNILKLITNRRKNSIPKDKEE